MWGGLLTHYVFNWDSTKAPLGGILHGEKYRKRSVRQFKQNSKYVEYCRYFPNNWNCSDTLPCIPWFAIFSLIFLIFFLSYFAHLSLLLIASDWNQVSTCYSIKIHKNYEETYENYENIKTRKRARSHCIANSPSSPFASGKNFRQTNGRSYHSIIFSTQILQLCNNFLC